MEVIVKIVSSQSLWQGIGTANDIPVERTSLPFRTSLKREIGEYVGGLGQFQAPGTVFQIRHSGMSLSLTTDSANSS